MIINDIENDYSIIQSKMENNLKFMSSIRSFLFYDVHCFEEFNKGRMNIIKSFNDNETETGSIVLIIKSLFDKIIKVIEDNKVLLSEIDKLKEDMMKLYDEENELNYQIDIINSQVNYYKNQNVEKDNYIFELKAKIADIQSNSQFQSDKSTLNLSYKAYDEIILPQRVIRKASEDKLSKRPNSSISLSNITDLNDDRSKFKYETHINYGYDYKNDELDSSLKKIDQSIVRNINVDNTNKESDKTIINKGTITRRVRDVIMNLYKNDSTVNCLQKTFGNDIIQMMSSGNIDSNTLDKVERIVNKKNNEVIRKENELKMEMEKCLDHTKAKSSGWDRLKGYIKIKSSKNN